MNLHEQKLSYWKLKRRLRLAIIGDLQRFSKRNKTICFWKVIAVFRCLDSSDFQCFCTICTTCIFLCLKLPCAASRPENCACNSKIRGLRVTVSNKSRSGGKSSPLARKVANPSLNFGYFVLGMHKHKSKSQIVSSLKSFFWFLKNDIPVVPGQAGGGSFQKEKNYIAQKEFAYRMRARRPTSAMPKSCLCCERAFCRSMVVMFCGLKWSVLMSWCLLRGQVMRWSRHLMRCDGLCCVMSRDAMRCHGDELYYSSTTLYYKVLFQYYAVLHILFCTTPVLPCTTKYYWSTTLYYSSITLYYKVLLQY